jgi:Tfp pilus assembly protein PilF
MVLVYLLPVRAEELPRNERNSAGTLINQDYFIANQYRETKELLYLLERHHLNQRVLTDFSAGRFNYALTDIQYILERMVNHPKALELMGSIARLTKAPSLPIPYYENALKLYPQYALTHAQYGAYLVDIGRIDAGIAKLKQAIEMDPKLAAAYAWLAKAYLKTGNQELARQAAEQAKALGYDREIR